MVINSNKRNKKCLAPKKLNRKTQRGRHRGIAVKNNKISFGDFGFSL